MLTPQLVDEIRRLLAEGKQSQRQIARMLRISRNTVGAIAGGRRPDYAALRRKAQEELEQPVGPPQRCRGCGGMVYLPCRLCRLRAATARRPRARPFRRVTLAEGPLGLNLKEEHRRRYEEVRARRTACHQQHKGSGG